MEPIDIVKSVAWQYASTFEPEGMRFVVRDGSLHPDLREKFLHAVRCLSEEDKIAVDKNDAGDMIIAILN